MKNILLAASFAVLATACSTLVGAPDEDPILGDWVAYIAGQELPLRFNADHTGTIEGGEFKWSRNADGTYLFHSDATAATKTVTKNGKSRTYTEGRKQWDASGVLEANKMLNMTVEDSGETVTYSFLRANPTKAQSGAEPPMAASAAKPSVPSVDPSKDPILGTWVGKGIYKELKLVFNADQTAMAGQDRAMWSRTADGAYYLHSKGEAPEEGMKAELKEDGRLGFVMNPDFDSVIYLTRPGEAEPKGPPPDPKLLTGEWIYVYTKNAFIAASPGYSSITFGDDGSVSWNGPIQEEPIKARVTVKDRTLSFKGLEPSDGETLTPNSGKFEYHFEDDSKKLILAPQSHAPEIEAEWVFVKRTEILENSIAGTWVSNSADLGPGSELKLDLAENGRRTFTVRLPKSMAGAATPPPNDEGFFVFWKSPLGPAITHIMFARDMGMFSYDVMLFEADGEILITTPVRVTSDGELKAIESAKMIWKQVK